MEWPALADIDRFTATAHCFKLQRLDANDGPAIKAMLHLFWWRRPPLLAIALAASTSAWILGLSIVVGPAIGFGLLALADDRLYIVAGLAGSAAWTLFAGLGFVRLQPCRSVLRRFYDPLASASDTGLVAVQFALAREEVGRAKRALRRAGIWRIKIEFDVDAATLSIWRSKQGRIKQSRRAPVDALRHETEALLKKRRIRHEYLGGSDPAG